MSRSIQSRSRFQWPRAAVAGALVSALAVAAVVPGAPSSRTASAEEQPLAGHPHASGWRWTGDSKYHLSRSH